MVGLSRASTLGAATGQRPAQVAAQTMAATTGVSASACVAMRQQRPTVACTHLLRGAEAVAPTSRQQRVASGTRMRCLFPQTAAEVMYLAGQGAANAAAGRGIELLRFHARGCSLFNGQCAA